MGLLGCMVSICLSYKKLLNCLPKTAVPFCIPTSNLWEFHLLSILVSACYCPPFNFWHSSSCVEVCHCGFNLFSLAINELEHLFIHLLPSIFLLWWHIQIFVTYPNLLSLLLDCLFPYYWLVSVLYIFGIYIFLSDMWFGNIFSQSVASFF